LQHTCTNSGGARGARVLQPPYSYTTYGASPTKALLQISTINQEEEKKNEEEKEKKEREGR